MAEIACFQNDIKIVDHKQNSSHKIDVDKCQE